MRPRVFVVLATALLVIGAGDASACDEPIHHALDFWVGEWTVRAGGATVGHNRIAKILDGCAITETWTDAGGGEGRSLFYFAAVPGEWRQVWVTANPAAPGGMKEKRRVAGPEGSVRFQGVVPRADGTSYLDRTTLTPLPDGTVRQHIEVSTDDGATWRTTFDAIYERVRGATR